MKVWTTEHTLVFPMFIRLVFLVLQPEASESYLTAPYVRGNDALISGMESIGFVRLRSSLPKIIESVGYSIDTWVVATVAVIEKEHRGEVFKHILAPTKVD